MDNYQNKKAWLVIGFVLMLSTVYAVMPHPLNMSAEESKKYHIIERVNKDIPTDDWVTYRKMQMGTHNQIKTAKKEMRLYEVRLKQLEENPNLKRDLSEIDDVNFPASYESLPTFNKIVGLKLFIEIQKLKIERLNFELKSYEIGQEIKENRKKEIIVKEMNR